jgi:hypothetical protein
LTTVKVSAHAVLAQSSIKRNIAANDADTEIVLLTTITFLQWGAGRKV